MDISVQQFSGCERVVLQAEISARHRQAFDAKYSDIVGKRAGGESFIPTENRDTHKAPILTVFFTKAAPAAVGNLRTLGFGVQDFQKGEFAHAVAGERLFWAMVRNGYRVGSQRGILPPVLPLQVKASFAASSLAGDGVECEDGEGQAMELVAAEA